MPTLHFGATDRKVFTPISAALGALSNVAGTIVVLFKNTVTGGEDYAGVTNSGSTAWYHALSHSNGATAFDDDQPTAVFSTANPGEDTTNWWIWGVDWPLGTAQTERFHWRNQTTLSSWTPDPASAANSGQRAGPGTSGWMVIGYFGDYGVGQKDIAVVAVWAGTRFADSDYGLWTKTSDLYNHPKGPPSFLCEVTATTLIDLIGGSTYSSANSSGTTLTGANPSNWTFDGLGFPTFVSYTESGSASVLATTGRTTASIPVTAGDKVVVFGAGEDSVGTGTLTLSLGGGLTSALTEHQRDQTSPSYAPVVISSADVNTTGNITATVVGNTANTKHMNVGVWVIRDHGGIGVSGKSQGIAGTVPSLTLNGCSAHSRIIAVVTDWSAANGARTYTTVNSASPVERGHFGDGVNWHYDAFDYADNGVVSNPTLGESAPTGQKPNMVAVEVLSASPAPVASSIWTPHRMPLGV